MFDPQPSDDLKGHFKTYLEMINCSNDDLPKYSPQQILDLARCSVCKDWHFYFNNRDPETQKIAASESEAAKLVESQSWQRSP